MLYFYVRLLCYIYTYKSLGTAIASSSIEDFLFKLYIKGCLQSDGSHDSKEKDVICCGSSCSIFVIRFPRDRVNYYKRHSEANCRNGTHCNEPHTELEEEVWSVFQKLKLSPVPPVSICISMLKCLHFM